MCEEEAAAVGGEERLLEGFGYVAALCAEESRLRGDVFPVGLGSGKNFRLPSSGCRLPHAATTVATSSMNKMEEAFLPSCVCDKLSAEAASPPPPLSF